jgi:ribonuclease Z
MLLTILGNGSGGPVQKRHYTAQTLQVENQLFLIDCGEGTQQQLFRYRVRYDRFRQIFISHLHGDHVFGLVGLLTSYSLKGRVEPMELYSPPGLRALVECTFRICGVQLSYSLVFHEVDCERVEVVFENTAVTVSTIPLHHGVPCTGWLFREQARQPNLRKDQIEAYEIPWPLLPAIKAGGDYVLPDGRVVPHDELVTPAAPPRAYAFCSDTGYSERVVEAVRGVDLLYHEATFTEELRREAGHAFHASAAEAATVAQRAGVGRLLLGHLSARFPDPEVYVREAQAIFKESTAAEEGEAYFV